MRSSWSATLFRIVALFLAGLVVGWLYDQPLIGGIVALGCSLGWHLLWLYRLDHWLDGEKMEFLPEGSDVWSRVFARIDFVKQRGRRRSKRFKALVKQLRQATRSFPDGGVILNENNEIVVFNRAARNLLGLKKQDRGLRIENLLRNPDFVDYIRAAEPGPPIVIRSPLNNERWLTCHVVPYGFDQQMLLIRDVTQQRKAEDMRRDFVANASHELRTPLTVITGYLDAFAEDPSLAPDLQAPIEEMLRQSHRMRVLVDELLRLSELESGSGSAEGEPVNIHAIIDTARQEARAFPGGPRQVTVEYESDSDLRGVAKDIQSVVSNLVSNALRYTSDNGQIGIRWWTDGNGGHLSVRDSGVGISKEHIPRLCERFYRVENGRERIGGEGGTGLGLAIVKHALLRHGAELEIESEVGAGSVFTCHFPAERIVAIT